MGSETQVFNFINCYLLESITSLNWKEKNKMAFNIAKCLRAENKRLQSLVTKLTDTNEALNLQLKRKEDDLTKRRIEVATLHQACAM